MRTESRSQSYGRPISGIIGPITYGVVTSLTDNNHRLAILVTGNFFVIELVLLPRVDMQWGMVVALTSS